MSTIRLFIPGLLVILASTGCEHHRAPASQPTESPYELLRVGGPSLPAHRAPRTAPTTLPTRDAAVLEAAFRDQLRHAERNATVFISLGPPENWQDPPPQFLERLNDLHHRLKPVSKARFPERAEMETPDRFRGVEDPATGKRSWIYWAEISNWVSETEVRVDVGVFAGPLAGGGGVCVFELRNGKWILTNRESYWRS